MNDKVSSELKWTQERRIVLPSEDSETLLPIRKADWEGIKRRLSEVPRTTPWLSRAYSILFGISGTAGLSIIPLLSLQGLSSWVIPAYVCLFVSTLILGFVFLYLDRWIHSVRKSDLSSIETDMENIDSTLQTRGDTT